MSGDSFAGGCFGAMFGIGALCLVGVLLCGGCLYIGGDAMNKAAQEVEKQSKSGGASASGLSMAKFKSIRNGMSKSEVVKILGTNAELVSESEIAGIRTEMYIWKGSIGSNCSVMFQNGQVMQKAQFGLR